MQTNFIGIEIGGTKLQLVAGDATEIRLRQRLTVDPSQGGPGIRRQIQPVLADLVSRWQPAALGVGFGGPVDWKTGRIARSHQIEGWSGFELGPWLEKLAGRPVVVDNDANMAALGEAMRGAGVDFDPVFYVTLGSGVGGGLTTGQRIYHGAKPGEAEIGHLRLDRHGTTVESRCSGWAVDERIRQLKARGAAGLLGQLVGDSRGGEARFLAPALAAGDSAARLLLQEIADDLAFGLSHVIHLFHPEAIVLGGGLSLLGEPLRAAIAEALPAFVMQVFAPGPAIRLAALGEDAVPAGCLIAAQQAASA